jgi:hypothetical protein
MKRRRKGTTVSRGKKEYKGKGGGKETEEAGGDTEIEKQEIQEE